MDRWLASVFGAEPIADNGFSKRIVFRIRRRVWIDRLALPVAAVIGLAFALKPATQLVLALLPLLNVVPAEMLSAPLRYLPQMQFIVLGGMVFGAAITLFKLLEET